MTNRILKKNISLFLFCGLGSCYVQAQEFSSDKVYISGHVVNEKETIGKSIVKVYGSRLTITPLREERTEGYDDSLNTKNHFSFELDHEDLFHPNASKLSKVNIALIPENREYQRVLEEYPVEPGDSIYITLETGKKKENGKVIFTGRGAAKYQCRREIEEELLREKTLRMSNHNSKRTIEDFKKVYQFQKEREKKALNILRKYKNSISERAYALLKADIMSRILQRKLAVFFSHYKTGNIPKEELLEFVGYTDTDDFEVKIFYDKEDPYMAVLCPNYPSYLLTRTALELYIKKEGRTPLFQEVVEAVIDNYFGITRECMLRILVSSHFDPYPFFTSNFERVTSNIYDSVIDTVMAVVKTPFIREKIESRYRIKKGMSAYNFAFTDSSGKLVKLEDFQGKTVLLDVWGTGCGGCAVLAKYIKDHIKPEFGDNDDFVVVSINTDKKKERWLKSLESELYSEKEDVNLYTNGEGIDHEIAKYYGISALPFSLLIDKDGKVVSFFSKDKDPEENIELIRNTIGEY
ncbi:Peroxiredoxin [Sinomicrobium oceani]|uniref:Peroxiredoxin n=1 Tax=Sinomicrobium oceani TaxID=1150368 RepID=A0A1K1MCM3_9FLAO|nr:TlpA disulfide reductase family protein [Sinomicrobium oceani]SFW20809.1 Peroxiredoxin [Sinomicrobium oceani]